MPALFLAAPASAQVVLDGTLGSSGSVAGPNYAITEALGRRVGNNLFHSFKTFDLAAGQTATFSGAPGTLNVISRVTGPAASSIDGRIRSSIAGASFFLINPHGVAFGPNARLDVGGSFHASSAGYLKLGSSGRFDAVNPSASTLTVDAPSAFGFVGTPAAVTLDRSHLHVPAARTLSLVGGRVSVTGGTGIVGIACGICNLWAPGGRIYIASVASPGEVSLGSGAIGATSAAFGSIAMNKAIVNTDAPGSSPGPIFIRGGQLTLDGTVISALNQQAGAGADIDVTLSGDLRMTRESALRTSALVGGDAGDVRIRAANVAMAGKSNIETSSVDLEFGLGGRAGATDIQVPGTVSLSGGSEITSISFFGPAGGEMRIRAGTLSLSEGSSINASTYGNGDAGRIVIEVGSLRLASGGNVLAGSLFDPDVAPGFGAGGDIVVNAAGDVEIGGGGSGIFSVTEVFGRGGTITLRAANLRMADGGRISTASTDPLGLGFVGDAGSIDVTAASRIELTGGASISTESVASGGGVITLRAADVLALADSSITTSVADGAGNGGDINIDPVFVVLNNSQIIARAVGGNGGDITIVTQFLISDENSVIDASSRFGLSGQVVVTAPEVDVSSRLATLSSAYVDPASRLRESCATRAGAGNSFVGVGRGGLPSSPQSAAFAAYGGFAPLAVALPGGARSCPS